MSIEFPIENLQTKVCPDASPETASIANILDLILSGNDGYKREIDALANLYKAQNSDCAYLAHRYADYLYSHVMDSTEDEQAHRCIRIEAINLAEILDAVFSQLNRHSTRVRYFCDDLTLNSNPEMLIGHHYDSGGAACTRKMFAALYI